MTTHRAIITVGIPDRHDGRFLFEAGVVAANDERGTTTHGRMVSTVKLRDFFIGLKDTKDVRSYRIVAKPPLKSAEGFITWITDPAIQNVNPLDRILDIEAEDGVITPVDTWENWDKRLVEVKDQFPASTTALCETAVTQIVIDQLVNAYEIDGDGYELHFYHQGTVSRGKIAQRVEDDWNALILHEPDDEEATLPIGIVAKNQKAPTEFILRLISAATVIDDVAGIKDREQERKTHLGKQYAATQSSDSIKRYYPVFSIEQHPRAEASVVVKGWLFAFKGADERGEENAKSDFIRSLVEISKATVGKAQLNDPDLYNELLDAFAPRKDGVSISLDEPGALKTFFLGDVLADLGEALAAEAVAIWQQSADEADLVKAALAYQRSSVVQINGKSDPEPSDKAPEESDELISVETEAEEDPAPSVEKPDTSTVESTEGNVPAESVREPNEEDEQPLKGAEASSSVEIGADNPAALLEDLEKIRTEGNAKPDTRFKKIKARLKQAGETEVFIGLDDLCKRLDEAGFTVIEAVPTGLRVTIPNDGKVRNLTGKGQGDVFFPSFHAAATCGSLKPSSVNDRIVEAISHPVLGPPLHWPRALISALKDKGDPAERLLNSDGACAEILVFKFLDWLLSDPKEDQTPDPKALLTEIVGDASAVQQAIDRLAAAVEASSADEDHNPIDEASDLWTGDLKSGQAFYENAGLPPKSEEIPI